MFTVLSTNRPIAAILRFRAGRLVCLALGLLLFATAVGVGLLWPQERKQTESSLPTAGQTERAEVVGVSTAVCPGGTKQECRKLQIKVLSGPDKDKRFPISLADPTGKATFELKDRLRVIKNEVEASGSELALGQVDRYTVVDFERQTPMVWLVAAFVLLVVILGKLRGLRSLLGLCLSLFIVVSFVIPAVLSGRDPFLVALVGALLVMFVTVSLSHGLGVKSVSAMLGTAASLLLTAGLAVLFVDLTNLSGLSSEEAVFLTASSPDISLSGLVLAGMVIGALGVLDDVTVSQASTVMALKRANEKQSFVKLYREGLAVGRDHLAATVNTLALAYVGAALPILLIFGLEGTDLATAVNRESVSEAIVATLVGSIGLIAAVPLTTALTAALVDRLPTELLGSGEHGHSH